MSLYDVEALGRDAYVWGWPLVNAARRADHARFIAGKDVVHVQGAPVGYGQIVMLTGHVGVNQRIICCPSRDVIYGSGVFHLTDEPQVIQIPDFGNHHWLYAFYNARTTEFSKIGRQYGTKTGFHLLVGPDWKEVPPEGIDWVWQSDTDLAFVFPRVYTDGTKKDLDDIKPILSKICSYPLKDFKQGVWQTRDWTKFRDENPIVLRGRGPEARYVKPDLFIHDLRSVLEIVPQLAGEKDRYDRLREVLGRVILEPWVRIRFMQGISDADANVVTPMMQWKENGNSLSNGWYTSVHAGDWSLDEYAGRTATAKSNMFENRAEETKYFYTDTDSSGQPLFGSWKYSVTFAPDQVLKLHARGFWSMTVYDEYHFFNTVSNPNDRYSIGTKDEGSLVYGADGSLTLYTGGPRPQDDRNWISAPKGELFSLYIRAYWPDNVILGGQWQPPKIARLS